jgi:hypothetical protein
MLAASNAARPATATYPVPEAVATRAEGLKVVALARHIVHHVREEASRAERPANRLGRRAQALAHVSPEQGHSDAVPALAGGRTVGALGGAKENAEPGRDEGRSVVLLLGAHSRDCQQRGVAREPRRLVWRAGGIDEESLQARSAPVSRRPPIFVHPHLQEQDDWPLFVFGERSPAKEQRPLPAAMGATGLDAGGLGRQLARSALAQGPREDARAPAPWRNRSPSRSRRRLLAVRHGNLGLPLVDSRRSPLQPLESPAKDPVERLGCLGPTEFVAEGGGQEAFLGAAAPAKEARERQSSWIVGHGPQAAVDPREAATGAAAASLPRRRRGGRRQ